ncbi:MAG: hypothetical protein Q8R30_03620 [bacterium]|nr:hypothetical protein [bacterium]
MAREAISLQLHEFGISPSRGFLPFDPLTRIPYSEVFSPLEQMANELPKLLAVGALRNNLDSFSRSQLSPLVEDPCDITLSYTYNRGDILQRTKLIFDYLAQAYVWGEYPAATSLPPGFSKFFYHVSKLSGLPPILTYAPYALWNWRRLDPSKPIELSNLAVIQNFLGGLDEDWFVLVHVDIESRAGTIPGYIARAMEAASDRHVPVLMNCLKKITASLKNMLETLDRMTEKCDPYIYYTRVRPYLHGSKNNPGLPNGLLYPGVEAYHNTPQTFRGESGAQSAIIPSLVAALDIRHTETAFTPYLQEIRAYMPRGHRQFVEKLEELSRNGHSILDFVLKIKDTRPDLYEAYGACRQALYHFRQKHYQYVWQYIHSQAQQDAGNPTEVGTAGTPFMTSLKQLMDETWFE